MIDQEELRTTAEQRMLTLDCDEALLLVVATRSDPFFALASQAYLAFFVAESMEWIQKQSGSFGHELAAVQQLVQRHRAELKVLDDTRGGYEFVNENLETIAADQLQKFLEPHDGLLGPLKRLLQEDMGIQRLDGHLVLTTHIPLYRYVAGGEPVPNEEALGRQSYHYARLLGSFLGTLGRSLGLDPAKERAVDVPRIVTKDVKATRYYRTLGTSSGFNERSPALSWLAHRVNTVHRWLRPVCSADSELFLRLRVLTVFHSLQGFRKFTNGPPNEAPVWQANARIQATASARALRRHQSLRNGAAHYGLTNAKASILGAERPFSALVESELGSQLSVVDEMLDELLEAISTELLSLGV